MPGKNKISQIRSLQQKKYRKKLNLFFVEGIKNVTELLKSDFEVTEIMGIPEMLDQIRISKPGITITKITTGSYNKISTLKTSPGIMAICKIPIISLNKNSISNNLNLVLDAITDPGNLGTILRTAHWFGIKNIICSPDCVDVFNPKVVQSAMGSITNVNVVYANLPLFLEEQKNNGLPVYGTFLKGENVYKTKLEKKGFLVLGNESNGITQEVEKCITKKLSIPQFTGASEKMDSLNVSIACAVFCSEFSR